MSSLWSSAHSLYNMNERCGVVARNAAMLAYIEWFCPQDYAWYNNVQDDIWQRNWSKLKIYEEITHFLGYIFLKWICSQKGKISYCKKCPHLVVQKSAKNGAKWPRTCYWTGHKKGILYSNRNQRDAWIGKMVHFCDNIP